MKIETTTARAGNVELHTCHEGQRIVLVHVRETGELCMGGMFRTGGFGVEWVPVLLEALNMAVAMTSSEECGGKCDVCVTSHLCTLPTGHSGDHEEWESHWSGPMLVHNWAQS